MPKKVTYNYFALLLLAVVLFPFYVQAAHTFEQHNHEVCTAKDVKHFHEKDIECLSLYHIPVEYDTNISKETITESVITRYKTSVNFTKQFSTNRNLSSKTNRGPPCILL